MLFPYAGDWTIDHSIMDCHWIIVINFHSTLQDSEFTFNSETSSLEMRIELNENVEYVLSEWCWEADGGRQIMNVIAAVEFALFYSGRGHKLTWLIWCLRAELRNTNSCVHLHLRICCVHNISQPACLHLRICCVHNISQPACYLFNVLHSRCWMK